MCFRISIAARVLQLAISNMSSLLRATPSGVAVLSWSLLFPASKPKSGRNPLISAVQISRTSFRVATTEDSSAFEKPKSQG